ncbi:MAG: hypothetical protein RL685_5767 [Pseudomonadota bacterium]|jgi:hypothetical protein
MATLRIEDRMPRERWADTDAFLARHYRPSYVLRQRPLFEWQFHDVEQPEASRVLCAYSGDELVGILGCIVVDVAWGDASKPVTGAWTANWMVAPEHRHGIGWLLIRRAQELFPVLLGQRANPANQQLTAQLGYRFFDDVPRFLAVIDPAGVLPLTCPGSPAAARAALDAPAPHWQSAHSRELRAAELADYRPDWSRYAGMHFGTLRSAGYLRWRYFEHPVFRYGVVVAGELHRPAVCVYRQERTSGTVQVEVGRIVEFFAPADAQGERDAAAALGGAVSALARGGAVFADLYCSSGPLGRLAERLGLLRLEHGVLASRLNPVELVADPQNLQLWAGAGGPAQLEDLYVTRSDGDQDRPNA